MLLLQTMKADDLNNFQLKIFFKYIIISKYLDYEHNNRVLQDNLVQVSKHNK